MGCVYRRFLIRSLTEKPVRDRRGHATVRWSGSECMPLAMLPGRFGDAKKSSQENCLFNDHHLTCEGWGRGSKDRTGAFRSFRGGLFCLRWIDKGIEDNMRGGMHPGC